MAKLNVDTKLIETLAELLQRTGLTEIEVAEGEARIRVAREPQPVIATAPTRAAPPRGQRLQTAAEDAPPAATTVSEKAHPGAVQAPMVGTVYLTPEPGAQPFVSIGDEVREGQTLLIIEAMKVMNPIRALKNGRIVEIAVGNGDPVEYGELLMIIE
jgi:acetyl-CoA carboxylase biotin carboxyl carrier protein